MKWRIHADGTFDINAGFGALRGCRPAVDHAPVCPIRVEAAADAVAYHLAEGTLRLSFASVGGRVELKATLAEARTAPRWLSVVAEARLEGFDACFRQGIGFSGPSGALRFAQLGDEWHVPSHMLLALLAMDSERTMTVAPHETRGFLFRADLRQTAWRHNFRNREVDGTRRTLELAFRTESIPLDGPLTLPTLHVQSGEGLFGALREAARGIAAAAGARSAACGGPASAPRYHYCSWYHRAEHFSHGDLRQVLDGLDRADPSRHAQTVQVDMGYGPHLGDWLLPSHKWPDTLKPAIAEITARGYAAGVWVGPFMVGNESRLAQEHPDWLLRDNDGNRLVEWRHYDGQHRDHEHYVLDTSHPGAMEYLIYTFKTLREWGVTFFKTDFLEWGYKDSTKVRRHTPGKTGAQYFDDALRAIRGAIGGASHWLACISYFAPCVGYVDSMRVSSDVGVQWGTQGGNGNDGVGGGTQNMIEESFATLYQNNILWQCDPDVVFLRDWHIHHQPHETLSLARWHGLLGHSVNISDEIGDLPPARLALWRWMRPQAEPWTAELPYFASGHTFRVAVRDYPQANGWAVLLLNAEKDARLGRCELRRLVGMDTARVFRWSPDAAEPLGEKSEILCELDGHASELLFVSRDGAPPPPDLNMGGSRGAEPC